MEGRRAQDGEPQGRLHREDAREGLDTTGCGEGRGGKAEGTRETTRSMPVHLKVPVGRAGGDVRWADLRT